MSAQRTNIEALGLIAGFGLWSLAFVVLYGLHGYACGTGLDPGAARIALILLLAGFIAAHALLALLLVRRWRRALEGPVRWVRLASLVLAVAAGATTAWTGIPVLTLSICA